MPHRTFAVMTDQRNFSISFTQQIISGLPYILHQMEINEAIVQYWFDLSSLVQLIFLPSQSPQNLLKLKEQKLTQGLTKSKGERIVGLGSSVVMTMANLLPIGFPWIIVANNFFTTVDVEKYFRATFEGRRKYFEKSGDFVQKLLRSYPSLS